MSTTNDTGVLLQQFDNLAVPGGSWFEHVNTDDKRRAVLFVASDEPAVRAGGAARSRRARPLPPGPADPHS
jgi:gentisate 1,2-dioxygenase